MKPSRQLQELLTQKKLKRTPQRTLIWDLIRQSRNHPSVEDLHRSLQQQGHGVGVATIYRTIKLLLESGLIRQTRISGATRYEALVGEPNHLHFTCNACGTTVEFSSKTVESAVRKVTSAHGFEARYSRYMVTGLCRSCTAVESRSTGLTARQREHKAMVRDALELTLAVERRGYSFYTHASRRTKNSAGRLMFLRLAEEEAEHMRQLEAEHRSLLAEHQWLKREPVRLAAAKRIADRVFPRKRLLRFVVGEGTTEREALDIAVDLERRSHQFFMDFASNMGDRHGREFFSRFAREEESHLKTLLAEYSNIGS